MTKKHFIALADAMRRCRPDQSDSNEYQRTALTQWQTDLRHVANFCQGQNPNFNYDRWMGYVSGTCGPNGGTPK
jgi:hypothetical protein